MRRRAITLGALLSVAGCLASSAVADPIHVVYRIDVFQRCTFVSDAQTCDDFRVSFPLTLTFDSQIVSAHGDDSDRTQFYGEPTVSAVPLGLRSDFPAFGPARRSAAERARFSADQQAWIREGGVTISQILSVDRNDFHRDLSLQATGEFPSVPQLNAQSFAQFLATAPFRQFSVADSLERADGGFELLGYTGHVSLQPAAVTPEPASLLLVSTGIAAVGFRRRVSRSSLTR